MFTVRILSLVGMVGSLSLVSGAYFLEYYFKLDPCPLCHLQRYVLFAITFFFFVGIFFPKQCGRWLKFLLGFVEIVLSVLGISLALRHIWLQYTVTDDMVSNCTAGLERLLQFQPLMQVLEEVLIKSNACGKIDFTILKLPLSVWSLFGFIALLCYSCWIIFWIIKRRI